MEKHRARLISPYGRGIPLLVKGLCQDSEITSWQWVGNIKEGVAFKEEIIEEKKNITWFSHGYHVSTVSEV